MNPEGEVPVVLADMSYDRQAAGQCDCNCDCACSMFSVPTHDHVDGMTEALLAGTQSFRRASPSRTVGLDRQHSVLYGPEHRVAVLNPAALHILSRFDRSPERTDADGHDGQWKEASVQSAIRRMIAIGLLRPQDSVTRGMRDISRQLAAWIHVTDRCNLRCAYCYLPHVQADMSLETGFSVVDATLRSAMVNGYRQVKLKYGGGEATLRMPFVAELHHYARERAHEQGLDLEGVVLSNGTLLSTRAIKVLQALDLRLMISLDNVDEKYDRQRPSRGGIGSSKRVMRAVDRAVAYGLVPDISITVTGYNAEGLPEVLAWVLDRDLPFSLNFYRDNDCSSCAIDLALEQERIVRGMLAAFKVIEARLPRRSLLASLVDLANLSAGHCHTCGVGQSYLVFDHEGRVAKCQMQMHKPVADSHDFDPLRHVRMDRHGIQNLPVEEKEDCCTCEWKYWCAGGCPLAAFRATGRYDVKSPNCDIYRALYPEVIRLEGLRLLKQG